MLSNPIVEQLQEQRTEERRKQDFRYPFHIVCVYMDEDSNDFPIITEVKEYCARNNLTFMVRQYDIDRFDEDMFIKRLPAFHLFYKKYIQDTEYYDTNPVHKIQIAVWAYQDELRAKERARIRRQERWDTFKESIQSIFTLDHFKRKPALDPEASLSHARMTTPSEERSKADSQNKKEESHSTARG